MFRDNYMVLEGFLSDAANRIETLIKQGYSVSTRIIIIIYAVCIELCS